jgi:antitoxin component YwqK of YwqJK toxin-antitoxin module
MLDSLTSLMKVLAVSMVVAFVVTSCAAKNQQFVCVPMLTSINIIDRNGLSETINNPERIEQYATVDFLTPQPYQKVLRIYSRDASGNIPASITSYHPNGSPMQYLEVVNSRAAGAYKEWHPNGVQKVSATIVEGKGDIVDGAELTWIFDGCSQVWDECGNLQASIPYSRGDLEGVSIYYHANGNIWKTVPFQKNHVNGTVEIYREDGSLLLRTAYSNGVIDGESTRYWDDDSIAAEENYCDGLLSYGRYFDKKGECIASIDEGNGTRAIFGREGVVELHQYRYGILEGEIKVLDRYGRIVKLYHVKNDAKHGEEMIFFEAAKLQKKLDPKLSITWFDGKVQGVAKTWYDNGVQESQKEMSNNKKNGLSTAWYRDGSIMMMEEYEQDHLVRGEYFSRGEKFPVSSVEEGNGVATLFDSEGTFINKINYWQGKPQIED